MATLQLTTGPACTCPYVGQTWHDGPMCWSYEQEPDPDCLIHRHLFHDVRMAPCTCQYVRHETRVALPLGPSGRRWRTVVVATAFNIDPACWHHGAQQQAIA